MLEILAPAGNADCAAAAINNGADAVYLGFSDFSARQGAENFDEAALSRVITQAHLCGVKVYVAMNTVVKDAETEAFISTLLSVWSLGADAVILQDLLLGKIIHATYPEICLHASTQAGICTTDGAEFAKECGFSRAILARETPLDEIGKITKIIETEAFVQGALCTCFSGQCYFSSFIGGNSGNRGRCKQPCRKRYSYDRAGFEEKSYALSLSDLSVGEEIRKYIEAGVTSFKIEGRMRRAEYVGAATRYYRSILDGASAQTLACALSDLKRTYNRGNYTKGLAFSQDKRFLSPKVQGHIGEKVGVVKVVNGNYLVESAFSPRQGDAFKILRDGKEVGGGFFAKKEKRGFSVNAKSRLRNGDSVFVTTDSEVNERVLNAEKKGTLSIKLIFEEGEFALAKCGDLQVISEELLQTAIGRPLSEEEIKSCFCKTDGLPVEILFEEVTIKGNCFMPKSKLNAFRRSFYEKIIGQITRNHHTEYAYQPMPALSLQGKNNKTAVISSDFEGVATDIAIYKPHEYTAPLPDSFKKGEFEKYLYYPAFATDKDIEELAKKWKECAIDGIYTENYGGIVFARKNGLRIFAGTGFNLINTLSVSEFLRIQGATYYTLSKETDLEEGAALVSDKAFSLACGDVKLMDLCYCPFGKTCLECDKKRTYTLTDENGRAFPVSRYVAADGNCRFEVYNCAKLIGSGQKGGGKLLDCTLPQDKQALIEAIEDESKQKNLFGSYTSGHAKKKVL